MKFLQLALILSVFVIGFSAAENAPAQQTDERFFGGGLFGNNHQHQCSNCRYNSNQARYCCSNGVDYNCCNYYNNGNYGSGVGGSSYNPGNGGYGYNKPGRCPSNYGRKRREAKAEPEEAPTGRWFGGGNYNNGYGKPPYNGGGLDWNYPNNNNNDRCYQDNDCPGSQKCCYSSYGGRRCTYPNNYYG